MTINRPEAIQIAVSLLNHVKENQWQDKKIDAAEIGSILSDTFDHNGSNLVIDSTGDGKIGSDDKYMAVLKLIMNNPTLITQDPGLKEVLNALRTKLHEEIKSGKYDPQRPPLNFKFDGVDYTDETKRNEALKYKPTNPALERLFRDTLLQNLGKVNNFSGMDAAFAKKSMAMHGGESAKNLVKAFWENSDLKVGNKSVKVFRMGEIVSAFKYIESLNPAQKDAFKQDFITEMAKYINEKFGDKKEFVLVSLLGVVSATDFSASGEGGKVKDFALELAKTVGSRVLDPEGKKAVGDILLNFDSEAILGGKYLDSIALVKGNSDVHAMTHAYGSELYKSTLDLDGSIAAVPKEDEGAEKINKNAGELDKSKNEIKEELKKLSIQEYHNLVQKEKAAKIEGAIPQLVKNGDLIGLLNLLGVYKELQKTAEGTPALSNLNSKLKSFVENLEGYISRLKDSPEFIANVAEGQAYTQVKESEELKQLKDILGEDNTALKAFNALGGKLQEAFKDPDKLEKLLKEGIDALLTEVKNNGNIPQELKDKATEQLTGFKAGLVQSFYAQTIKSDELKSTDKLVKILVENKLDKVVLADIKENPDEIAKVKAAIVLLFTEVPSSITDQAKREQMIKKLSFIMKQIIEIEKP